MVLPAEILAQGHGQAAPVILAAECTESAMARLGALATVPATTLALAGTR